MEYFIFKLAFFYIILNIKFIWAFNINNLNLPLSHVQHYFNKFQNQKINCLNDNGCIYRNFLNNRTKNYNNKACWGYEKNCDIKERYSKPECQHQLNVEGRNNKEIFFHQADFGYVKDQINEITTLCAADHENDSLLECSKYLRFCRGRNIFIDFTNISKKEKPFRYKTDVLKNGQIGGNCNLYKKMLISEMDHFGALQSWAPELRNFKQTETSPLTDGTCDITIDAPTILMKLDAQSNLYHHFCDFLNLYMSLHVNQTDPNAFRRDVQIIIWETYDYYSPFGETFNAFSNNPIWNLNELSGKKVCFRNLLMPLLPRMIFGLYYNTPIVSECLKSGMFKAFSDFILHRLEIPFQQYVQPPKIRLTLILRKTKHRRILNANDLVEGLNKHPALSVTAVSFESLSFRKQLEVVRNTDILIGMHGAGLTHLLFLPDWAVLFELFNTGDPNCYKDLARLRGINYMTWEDNSKLVSDKEDVNPEGAHEKFKNYTFDTAEFLKIVERAIETVESNEKYIEFINRSRSTNDENKDEL